jgi:hypothetical protein
MKKKNAFRLLFFPVFPHTTAPEWAVPTRSALKEYTRSYIQAYNRVGSIPCERLR